MPGQPVVLDTFGGMVASARPEDIPEGASPRCNDVDFIVGRFVQRPGLQSQYTIEQSITGPFSANSAVNVSLDLPVWSNPSNVLLNDGSFASVSVSFPESNYAVASVDVTNGGYYPVSLHTSGPVATISGPGYGATVKVFTEQVTAPIRYEIVSSVEVLTGGIYEGPATITFSGSATGDNATATTVMADLASTVAYSDPIFVSSFSVAIPPTSKINGIGVNVKGYEPTGTTAVYAQLVKNGVAVGNIEQIVLPTSNGFVGLGGSSDLWGEIWLNSDVEASNFGVNVWIGANATVTAFIDYVDIVFYTAASPADFNGITDANLNQSDQVTLVLDANGLTWEEDVTNNPNVLSLQSLIPNVVPGSYMKGLDVGGTSYMAYSDLTQGTSQPMQFNGEWCDRITQVGAGQAPVFTPLQATSNTFDIATITQNPANSDITDPGHISVWLQSSGPGSTSPGNTVTVYYSPSYYGGSPQPGAEDQTLVNAFNSGNAVYVYLAGTPITGTYQVTSVGNALPPGVDHWRYYFTIQVTASAYQNIVEAAGTYQMTVATMTTTTPVPNLSVGNKITISGNSQSSYNAQWTITEALNSGEMGITSTSVTSSVATYEYALDTGAPPNAGQLVTVTNTTNADGALNVVNAVIQSSTAYGGTVDTSGTAVTWVSGNNFSSLTNGEPISIGGTGYTISTVNSSTSITLTSTARTQTGAVYSAGTTNTGSFTVDIAGIQNFPSVPESGVATTAGTIFAFDPGFLTLGTSTNPIYGNGTGGSFIFVSAASQVITAGVKQASVFFITRNGAVTRPAPPAQVTIPENCGAILVTNIPIGPPNVVQRGITFTESGQNGVAGASFYTYDTAQTYYVNGIEYTSDALIVNDNTTVSATFSFSDTVLLASDEIDIPGNDYFNLMEIGSPAWIFKYADRVLYGLCQNQVQNFLNMTFDGGYLPVPIGGFPLPLGWTVVGSGNLGNYTVTGFSITDNVVTVLCSNFLEIGYNVQISGLSTGTYLNGITLTVLTANSTEFTASFDHSNVGSTTDSGTVFVNSPSIGLVPSLDFGNAFRMMNLGSSAWTDANVIYQSAYQDYLNVAIIQPNTPYSVRVKARAINANAQQMTVQFNTFSGGSFGTAVSTFTGTFNEGPYQILTGSLLSQNQLPVVPSSFIISVGVSGIGLNCGIEIDRIEIFPTDNPVLITTVLSSYEGNYEAVDINTGTLGVGDDNPQPAVGAFEFLEQLYIEKTASMCVTQDSPNYEPNQWQVRQTSDRAGAVGPNAFDEGEEFCLSASRNGIYFFDGGKPMPVMRELQSTAVGANLWEQINWSAGKTIWLRNDLENRRLYIGLPLITPNFWLPNAPASGVEPSIRNVQVSFVGPRVPSTLQVTFAANLPPLVANQTYTFSGLTNYTSLNGSTLTPVQVVANVATFLTGLGAPSYNSIDTGTADISGYSVLTSPNVILMCNYTGCPTGEQLAESPEVHITMFGDLKALDMRRKWSLWQTVIPVAEFVTRQDGLSDPLFLGNGNASQKIYQFVPGSANGGQNTDDGAAINWFYTTYGFTKAKQGQQTGLGALRKVWYYFAATMEGIGQVAGKLLSNSLGALPQNTFTIPLPFTLSYPQQNDQERVIEIGGQRLFIEFSSIGTGGYAEIGPVIIDGEVDKNSPHRGVSS